MVEIKSKQTRTEYFVMVKGILNKNNDQKDKNCTFCYGENYPRLLRDLTFETDSGDVESVLGCGVRNTGHQVLNVGLSRDFQGL